MTPEHWRRIEELYNLAQEASSAEQAALLAQADPSVRRAVEAMLAQEAAGELVLDHPAWEHAGISIEKPATALAPGTQLGPYRIEAKLDEGGMGEVYRASDARLNRVVAVKVSATQFSDRFEREAKAIAALNHPNICQIYDVGPNYLVMEYVEGAPVKGRLPVEQALKCATQIAAALEAAHAKGIIHRDLKPANILTSSTGVVKLLDFGLAKQGAEAPLGDVAQTMGIAQAGMVMGTPAYMSPEQAEGKQADARSDIFSFGAVLYELLSGRRAFIGASTAATIGAAVHKDPDALNAPPGLAAIVRKCLAKSPDDRFQTVADLRRALDGASAKSSFRIGPRAMKIAGLAGLLAMGAVGLFLYLRGSQAMGQIDSIAILPLDIRSNDTDADYISDGITESVSNSLAKLPGLKVVPHSVAMHYKGKAEESQKIGEALGVQAVLTGRIAQRGDDLTIGIELDDVRNSKQLWGQQYNRKVVDLLTLQQDIAREVSQRLRSRLSAEDQQKLALGSTDSPEAYQAYLKGKYFTNKFAKDDFQKGIGYFKQAIARDPNYGLAYAGLAYNYINQDDWFIRPSIAAPNAREAAKRALAIDESDSNAHLSLAIETQWYEWDWAAAEREFKRAIELNPKNSDAYGYYAWFLSPLGRNDEAIAAARNGQLADPLSLLANFGPGSISVFNRQPDRAIEQFRSAIDLDANYWFDYCFLGRAYEQKGQFPEAIAAFQHALELEKANAEIWSGLGHAYAVSGNRIGAQQVLDHLKELSARSYVAPYNVAVVYAGLGDKDEAFRWLNRAFDERSYLLAIYLTTDSRLDNLHSDTRFADLRRRIGLPE
jgi:serine/threonine protein kinase/tetratricopeptide (TPR) repeat protein